jgi:acyl transferase domain-containing protein/NADPH:quinone reductase-like Zn-dependent oxidoreductase/NAD(P)-dependent dehydrogenase (short-subunit alcohol dehydrogenase family)/acyl carrier protein
MSDGLIAIVGASCRFPGADGLAAFWDLLASGRDAVTEVDTARWSTRFFYHPNRGEPGKSYTWSAGLLQDVDRFEPAFFGISPREAAQMDPQQRLMLELVWHAAEDAGILPSKLAGTGTGVYIGASSTDYRDLRLGDPASGDAYFMIGSTLSIVANRVSYAYDLGGPSLAIDTACSSSLVALHEACEAIRAERVPAAIVGGINLLLAPYPFIGFSRASMLSQRGRCCAFDERADGYVRGEGGGVVILKPLRQALADGDSIRAVIAATGVNSDGRTIGLSLPSEAAQASLIRSVYERAGITPDDLAFFEMHGTGTPAGDPTEAAAVGHALGQGRCAPLPIGSVKSNIGHLEPASGMAGLLKAMLSLEHRLLPPSLHCETPNPNIPFAELNLRLVRNAEPIETGKYAGINSFGFGGTNGHALLTVAPPPAEPPKTEPAPLPPLVISARSEDSLRMLAHRWHERLAATSAERAPVMLRATARGREHHTHRLVAWGENVGETAAALGEFIAGGASPAVVTGTALREGKLAFVFSGNGAQWPGMAGRAYSASAAFRAAIAEADTALRPTLGWSAAELIEAGIDAERLAHADIAQPLLFAIQVGIVYVLRGLGIEAAAHVGHSVGEIAAAWAAGVLSLADAARVVAVRSRNQERTRGTGRMAALALSCAETRQLLSEIGSPLEIGAINSQQSVTVSGPSEAIDALAAEAHRRGIALRALDLDFPFHSAAMDPIRDDLLAELSGLVSRAPRACLISTATGEPVTAGLLDADYWWRNIRDPVRFEEAIAALVADGHRIFVEIGPSPVLQSYLHDALRAAEDQGRVLGTLNRKPGDRDPFPAIVAQCYVAGHDITGAAAFEGSADPRGLPLYPWNRERFWFERTVEETNPIDPAFDHPLLGFRQAAAAPFWLNHLDTELLPWLADHAIEGVPVLPAAAVLEMALATARLQRPEAGVLEIADLELRRPLPFESDRARELRTALVSDDGDWELSSRPRLSDEPFTLHAVAQLVAASETGAEPSSADPGCVQGEIDGARLYRLAAQLGLDYGTAFRTVDRIELFSREDAVAHLDASGIADSLDPYLLHPALLDGAFQALLALIAGRGDRLDGISFLPWRFGRVRMNAPFDRVPTAARVRLTRTGSRSAAADIALLDRSGADIAVLTDCWFRCVELRRSGTIEDRALRLDLVPAPLDEPGPPPILQEIGATLPGRASIASDRSADAAERALLLDALIAAIGYRSISTLVDTATPFSVQQLIESEAVAPPSAPLAEFLLRALARFGAAREDGEEWQLAAEHDLPQVEEVWRLLLAETPEFGAELALTAELSEKLPQLLSEGLLEAAVAPPPMLDHLLHGSPASSAAIDLVADALAEIAAAWPKERPLRLLELAADGATTRRVLDRMAQSGAAVLYTATHPDPEPPAGLSAALAGIAGGASARWLPCEPESDLDAARFDVILSVNSAAGFRIEAEALARLAGVLARGGLFLAAEPEPNTLWDLVFGTHAGWWREGTAQGASPLRSAEDWRADLALASFAAAGTASISAGPWPSTLIWATAPGGAEEALSQPKRPLSVALIADETNDEPTLTDRLARAGCQVGKITADRFAGPAANDLTIEGTHHIALLVVDGSGDPLVKSADLLQRVSRLAAAAADRDASLWLVTAGAQQSIAGDDSGMVGAALWGFGRVLMNELPRLDLRLIDFPTGMPAGERADHVARELVAESPETEVVWTPSGRHVLRLRRGLPARFAAAEDSIALTSGPSGGLDSLHWSIREERQPGTGEIAIEVHGAGLNFRDVMWGMGLLPEEALIDGFAGATFGLECAGIVRAVGPGVDALEIGDRVAGFAPAALSREVITAAGAVMRIPADLGFAAAATLPVAFVTAAYALGTLCNLAPGEHVLIHAAAGGVGLAAIQYAKYRGAVVIATAGSDVKRAFLRLAGADHVLSSRDLGFADAVRRMTRGVGVDVVLNSLSGEAMEQSLGVLKPFGRFLELGKRDFYLNRRIHLRPLRQNISYFGIDVDQLPLQRPDLARSLLSEVSEAVSDGAVRPLAHRCFSFTEIDAALRLMQASGHIGKLVLVPNRNLGVRLEHAAEMSLRRDGTYLVTGGLTGFGFEAARWLAEHGAGSIALLGRRGSATPGAAERAAELRALGAEVSVYAGDVADPNSLGPALDRIRTERPLLRGVIHAASAIEDALASELNETNIARVLHAKLGGAMLLDRLTCDDPIELFLLFSSATTLLGAPGQGAYVAANLALEALARRRQAEGRPALAIAWGPIGDAGYLAERSETRDALARRLGAKPMPARDALAGIPAIAATGLPAVGFAETSWNDARRFLPILAAPLFAEVRGQDGSSQGDDTLLERLVGLGPEEALPLLKTAVAEEAASILRLPAGSIDPLRPLSEIGMDSLMAVELRLALENRLRIELPLMSLAEGTSVASIAGRLASAISSRAQSGQLVSMAERYEVAAPDGLAAVAEAAEMLDPAEIKSAAAE